MIPDPQVMINVIKEVEAAAHERGWDKGPALGVAFASLRGVPTVAPFPIQPDGDVVACLGDIADFIETESPFADPSELDYEAVVESFAGVWFLSEGWDIPPEKAIPGRKAADTVGAVEIRFCVMVDCAGLIHEVYRMRGEPARSAFTFADVGPPARGRVYAGLARLLLAVARHLPGLELDRETLGKVAAVA